MERGKNYTKKFKLVGGFKEQLWHYAGTMWLRSLIMHETGWKGANLMAPTEKFTVAVGFMENCGTTSHNDPRKVEILYHYWKVATNVVNTLWEFPAIFVDIGIT